ncbi:Centrosomal protein of 44 kDa [Collichthys lucidus]|uniref:Centrosomal protein of 44 kDa n=1 Tax=Collichthys lucidus TaxID=240159 RepID=A0A4U5U5P2_COLLU|nr:Centrosomal protein of 44 kDa [Collichthys lucidus]
MLSTGDVQGCLRRLETLLRAIKYPGHVDYNGLSKGDPSAFLPIVSFTLTSFSPPFAEQLMATGLELTGKTDLRFTDTLYKVLRDIFHYKPILTKQQFLQWGFSQRKISVICDIINLVLQKHNQLKKVQSIYCYMPMWHFCVESAFCLFSLCLRGFSLGTPTSSHSSGINRLIGDSKLSLVSLLAPALSDPDEDKRLQKIDGFQRFLEGDQIPLVVHIPYELMEFLLSECLSGLHRLSILEKRLEKLERNTDKNEGEVITISRESWENLMSRVLLLETKLELSNAQFNARPPCAQSTSSYFSNMSDASEDEESCQYRNPINTMPFHLGNNPRLKEDLKDKLERITNMLKSTSTLLKSTESSTTHCK